MGLKRRTVAADLVANNVIKDFSSSQVTLILKIFHGFVASEGFRAIALYRLSNYCYKSGFIFLAKIITRINYMTTLSQISFRSSIGPGLCLPHTFGVIIGWDTELGSKCFVGQHVTIGGNLGKTRADGSKYSKVGNGVKILTGSVIAGPINIGENVIIGANCVITKDVPSNTVVKVLKVLTEQFETVRQ
jgi:serine O-acetyltransferase